MIDLSDHENYLHRINIESDVRLKFFNKLNLKKYLHVAEEIEKQLRDEDVTLEGKPLFVSLNPTILYLKEVKKVADDLQKIHDLLTKVLIRFIEDYRSKDFNSPLITYFAEYKKWFKIIAEERRMLPPINNSRFDTTFDDDKGWKIMEINTRCP